MLSTVYFSWFKRMVWGSVILGALGGLCLPSARAASAVNLAWDASADPTVAGYNLYYGTTSRTYTAMIPAGAATSVTVSNLTAGVPYYFAATSLNVSGLESDYSVEVAYTIPTNGTNQPPTLLPLADVVVNENAGARTVNLSGIGSGSPNEIQTLTVTATSSNPGLIPNPAVSYTSPNPTGSITFTPVAFASGSAVITVTVNDGGASNNLVSQTFTVTVNSVNQSPTLNALANLNVNENAGPQTVSLAGISSGAPNEVQTLTVTATSSNPGLIPNPAVNYSSPNNAGSLSFTPVALANGSATITVTVDDGGASNNVVSRSFTVVVNSVNQTPTLNSMANLSINETAGPQTVFLTGISSGAANEIQTLTVAATSSNPGLIPNPSVTYTSPNATGNIAFSPVAYASGSATITVTVNDGGASNNVVSRSFTVLVNSVNQTPTLDTLPNLVLNENAGPQSVNLTGISSGAPNEVQALTVTATSSNPGLVPNPAVAYTSPSPIGTLSFTPVAFGSGTAIITVTVNDGGASNNVVSHSFTVTVNSVNQVPTLDSIANLTIAENAGQQSVNLTGISSGAANEIQTLTVTATSSNPGLIPNPAVNYASPNPTGALTFTPVANATGSAFVTVNVNDGGTSNNVVTRTFIVTVNGTGANVQPTLNPIADLTIAENSGPQAVVLSGISSGSVAENQTLTVSAFSSNPSLIPAPTVNYASPNPTGSLTLTPAAGSYGAATITVMVDDGGAISNTLIRSFTVTVVPVNVAPTINPISSLVITQNTGAQTVHLTGITAGGPNETQTLTVSAVAANPTLIPSLTVSYTSPNPTGTLNFTPATDAYGSTTITVTVNDGQPTNSVTSVTFNVTVYQDTSTNSTAALAYSLYWQHNSGSLAVWSMNGTNSTGGGTLNPAVVSPAWKLAGSGDLFGSGQKGVIFQHTSGLLSYWALNGTNACGGGYLHPAKVDPQWKLAAVGDFNGDGKSDLVFEHTNGALSVWFMDGTNSIGGGTMNPAKVDPSWRIVGTADFNNDGKTDLIWQHSSGMLLCWFMDGTNCIGGGPLNPSSVDATWRIAGAGNLSNGKPYLVWQHTAGWLAVWFMDGTQSVAGGLLNPSRVDTAWRAVGGE